MSKPSAENGAPRWPRLLTIDWSAVKVAPPHAAERDERTDANGRWTESNQWHRHEQECACGATRYRVKGGPWTQWESVTSPDATAP